MSDQTTAAPTRKPCGCEWFNDPPAKIGAATVHPQSFTPCAEHRTVQTTVQTCAMCGTPVFCPCMGVRT